MHGKWGWGSRGEGYSLGFRRLTPQATDRLPARAAKHGRMVSGQAQDVGVGSKSQDVRGVGLGVQGWGPGEGYSVGPRNLPSSGPIERFRGQRAGQDL